MSSRLERARGIGSTHHWVVEDLDHVPLDSRESAADGSEQERLARWRTAFYSPAFDLRVAPPLRVQMIRRPTGDLVMFNVAHPVVDGIGLLRFLTSLTRAYRGEEDPGDPLPLAEARRLRDVVRPANAKEAWGRALEGPANSRAPWRRRRE